MLVIIQIAGRVGSDHNSFPAPRTIVWTFRDRCVEVIVSVPCRLHTVFALDMPPATH